MTEQLMFHVLLKLYKKCKITSLRRYFFEYYRDKRIRITLLPQYNRNKVGQGNSSEE